VEQGEEGMSESPSKAVSNYGANWFSKLGYVLAVVLSWGTNHGFWWAVWHAICGWWYVVYWGFKYSRLQDAVQWLMNL
jgi:hypothetical protein